MWSDVNLATATLFEARRKRLLNTHRELIREYPIESLVSSQADKIILDL